MLFPSESITSQIRELFERLQKGELTDEQFARQSLEVDPEAAPPMVVLSAALRAADRFDESRDMLLRAIDLHPCEGRFFVALSDLIAERDLSGAWLELGLNKVLRNPGTLQEFETYLQSRLPRADKKKKGRALIRAFAEELRSGRDEEPEPVTEKLWAHRLIDDLLDCSEFVETELVDDIVDSGEECGPLLVGVLRDWAQEVLPDSETFPVEAALALLGEIGDPAFLPPVVEFATVNGDQLSKCAAWAVGRIVSREPTKGLAALRRMIPGADPTVRSAIGACSLLVPNRAKGIELLLATLDGLDQMDPDDRDELVAAIIHQLLLRSRDCIRQARAVLDQWGPLISAKARSEQLRILEHPPEPLGYPPIGQISIHDLIGEESLDEGDEDEEPLEEDEDEEYPEFEPDLVPEPIRRKPRPARNAPCWCGSGRKYKKCHLDSDERKDAEERKERIGPPPPPLPRNPAYEEATEQFKRFTGKHLTPAGEREIARIFSAPGEPDAAGLAWVFRDFKPKHLGGRTLAQEFARREGDRLSAPARAIAQAWADSAVSLYEVQRVEPGRGVEVKDLLQGGEYFVHDVRSSQQLSKWDCLLIRLVRIGERWEMDAAGLMVPRPMCGRLRDWIVEEQKKSWLPWTEYLRGNSGRIRGRLLEMQEEWHANPPQLVTAEGDPLVFSKAFFEVRDREALIGALEGSDSFVGGDDDFAWLETGELEGGGRRSLGNLKIAGSQATLECSSRRRLERGKKLLKKLAAGALKHRDDEFKSVESALAEAKKSGPRKAPPKIPDEVARELIGKQKAAHYGNWTDTHLPALGGKTPREAVATREGREKVIDLLKMIENGEEQERRAGAGWFDVSQLKAELNLDY